jgi:purine-nucleoside phosphorylase
MKTLTPVTMEEIASRFAAAHDPGRLRAALVAGSGITLSAAGWRHAAEVPYADIFPFEIRELPGHTPTVALWRRGDEGLLIFNGRFHLYQGYSVWEVAAIPRMAGLLGSPIYLATNAVGAIDPRFAPGSLVIVSDHLNLQGVNPLVGEWAPWRQPAFPDMTHVYDAELRELALRHANAVGFDVHEGVYAAVLGPSFETPSEVEMLRRAGASVVGMSTVPEVIAARHMGMRVLTISLATNSAAGLSPRPLTHEEVMEAGAAARSKLRDLIERLVADLPGAPA